MKVKLPIIDGYSIMKMQNYKICVRRFGSKPDKWLGTVNDTVNKDKAEIYDSLDLSRIIEYVATDNKYKDVEMIEIIKVKDSKNYDY